MYKQYSWYFNLLTSYPQIVQMIVIFHIRWQRCMTLAGLALSFHYNNNHTLVLWLSSVKFACNLGYHLGLEVSCEHYTVTFISQ